MSSAGPGDGGQRSQDQDAQRRDDEGPSSLGSDRSGPTTLQGLLRRLGADLSDIFPGNSGSSHTRLQQLRNSIASPESNEQQLEALSELCEFLSVGTEESMVSFSVNLFVGPLVGLLRTGANVEVKIFAARALTHMMEALPSSSSAIAMIGAAGPLCQNLLAIEYIDLAEQSLSALHKLSVDYPQQIVSANGFQAVLSFIDFFSIGVQRVAASTACNLCRSPRPDAMDMISGVLPTMLQLLDSDDQRIRESAVLGFTRLAEAFRSSSDKLGTLCGDDSELIEKILGLIVPSSPPALAPQSYSSALRLLALLSRGSAKLGLQILSTKSLIEKLNNRLSSDSTVHALDCLNLADSLLPEMPESEGNQSQAPRTRRPRRISSSVAVNNAVEVKRREDLERNMSALQFFGTTLFETLMKFYVSSADSNARRVSLSVMSKFIAIASNDILSDVIEKRSENESADQRMNGMKFCPFVSALLGENSSPSEELIGLAMAASALQKLPSLRDSFFREGVVHEIVRLAGSGPSPEGEAEGTGEDTAEADTAPDREAQGGFGPSTTDGGTLDTALAEQALNPDLHNMDSIWGAISSLQRGNWQRSSGRGDAFSPQTRATARALMDLRMPQSQSIRLLVSKAANSILKAHLGSHSDGSLNEDVFRNTSLGKLTSICNSLSSVSDVCEDFSGNEPLKTFVKLLTASDGLTVFEMSRSNTMTSLSKFLSPSNMSLTADRVSALITYFNADRGKGSFSSLVDLALGVLASEEKLPLQISEYSLASSSATSVSSGLRHLSQPFKLRLRKATAENGGAHLRDYSHHVVLIEPLATMASVQEFLWPRVREIERPATGTTPVAMRRRSSRGDRGERESAVLQDNDSGSGDGGDVNEPGEDPYDEDRFAEEMFHMQEENQDEDAVVEDDDDEHNSDGSDEDVSSGDEDMIEQDGGDSDENDNEGPDSMDVDQLARSVPPFELDHDALGLAPARGGSASQGVNTPTGGRGGPATRNSGDPSRNDLAFRSYAAALAANMQRSAGQSGRPGNGSPIAPGREDLRRHGRRSSSAPKLSFSLNDRAVAHDCSILSAVIQSSEGNRGIGPRLWSDVHVLVYSKVESDGAEAVPTQVVERTESGEGNGRSTPSLNDSGAPLRRSQRLQDNRERVSSGDGSIQRKGLEREPSAELLTKVSVNRNSLLVPRRVALGDLQFDVFSTLDVLRHLHWIYSKVNDRTLRLEGAPNDMPGLLESSKIQFLSHKLSAKMLRQLSDPLALCGGVIPEWCFSLSRDASFLIPFETRRILFQSSSLGVPRALHSLQTRTDISGVGNTAHRSSRSHREEARVGRLQRQKVRVHRQRILESAIKVINFYSTHNTVLEVQYFDEAGIGLGPTLEFYTMASRELQRVDLRLWRGNSDVVSKQKEIGGSVSAASRINHALRSTGKTLSGKRRSSRRHSTSSTIETEEDVPAFVIHTGDGLFPSCLPMLPTDAQKEAATTTTALFGFVGKLLGKAVVDGRLVDLRFSETFSRLLLSYCRLVYELRKSGHMEVDSEREISASPNCKYTVEEELDKVDREEVWEVFTSGTSSMKLLESVDVQLASSLKSILNMLGTGKDDIVSDLCLTFVLPGDDDIELVKGGSEVEVTSSNAEEYVRRVVYHVLFGGVYQQAEAMLRGLGELIDLPKLLMFESAELELMACGPAFEKWTVEFLIQATRCDHGYSHESRSVLFFLQIISELDLADQQRFVVFTTGAPALPLGGLRSLHPRLTIVRRTPESGRSPDECLPTVMTCTNYFKLPDYSSLEVAKKQIMCAVREGQRSFHLS